MHTFKEPFVKGKFFLTEEDLTKSVKLLISVKVQRWNPVHRIFAVTIFSLDINHAITEFKAMALDCEMIHAIQVVLFEKQSLGLRALENGGFVLGDIPKNFINILLEHLGTMCLNGGNRHVCTLVNGEQCLGDRLVDPMLHGFRKLPVKGSK